MMKFSRVISRVKWLSGEKNQRFEDHLCPRPQDVGFFTAQPFDAADRPRELHHSIYKADQIKDLIPHKSYFYVIIFGCGM
jgi:hypothetical protein